MGKSQRPAPASYTLPESEYQCLPELQQTPVDLQATHGNSAVSEMLGTPPDTAEADRQAAEILAFNEAESQMHPAWNHRESKVRLPGPDGGVQISEEDQMLEEIAHDIAYRDFAKMSPEERLTVSARLHELGYEMPEVLNDDHRGDRGTGFQALALKPMEGSGRAPVLAFRGTANFGGAETDLDASQVGSAQYNANRDGIQALLQRLQEETGQKVTLTGHSLGGALAQRAAAENGRRVGKVNTYQGAGVSADLRDLWSERYGPSVPADQQHEVKHFYSQQDAVHLAGRHLFGENIAVDTSPRTYNRDEWEAIPGVGAARDLVGGHKSKGLTSGRHVAQREVGHPSDSALGASAEDARQTAGDLYRLGKRTLRDIWDVYDINLLDPDARQEWGESGHSDVVERADTVESREAVEQADRAYESGDGTTISESSGAMDERMRRAHREEFHEQAVEGNTVRGAMLRAGIRPD